MKPALLLPLLVLNLPLALANGGGYNGPDLAPASIPVQLERWITVEEAQQAIITCFASGRPAEGLHSVLARAQAQLSGTLPTDFRAHCGKTDQDLLEPVDCQIYTDKLTATGESKEKPFSLFSNLSYWKSSDAQPQGQGDSLTINLHVNTQEGRQVSVRTRDSFPILKYEGHMEDPKYGELGEVNSQRRLTRLWIQVPANYAEQGAKMAMVNSSTNQSATLTLNAKEYVQCLQSEIQRQQDQGKQDSKQ